MAPSVGAWLPKTVVVAIVVTVEIISMPIYQLIPAMYMGMALQHKYFAAAIILNNAEEDYN